jgi:hypothetical protein
MTLPLDAKVNDIEQFVRLVKDTWRVSVNARWQDVPRGLADHGNK